MTAAIGSEIFQDAYLAAFNPDSEIYLISKIGGRLTPLFAALRLPVARRPAGD